MRYMLMMHAPRGTGDWHFMHRLNQELTEAGELVGAEGLAPRGEARVVRVGKSGVPAVTDGPFPEAKEFLAGYWIVEVDRAERAYEIAAKASAAPRARHCALPSRGGTNREHPGAELSYHEGCSAQRRAANQLDQCHHMPFGPASPSPWPLDSALVAPAPSPAGSRACRCGCPPRVVRDVLQVSTGVFAKRGPLAPPNGAVAAAAVSADNFAAQGNDGSVSGTVEVLGIAPLRLRLDLLATSAGGDEIRIQGDMTAQLLGNTLGCD